MSVIKPGGAAPPADHFELGAWVSFHHRAAVARIGYRDRRSYWYSAEGGWPSGPPFGEDDCDPFGIRIPEGWNKRNKSIVVWPERGEAMVIGLARRGIGHGWGASGGYGGFYDDYEPGGFTLHEWHWLYVLKPSLSGTKYWLAPMWATRRAGESNS